MPVPEELQELEPEAPEPERCERCNTVLEEDYSTCDCCNRPECCCICSTCRRCRGTISVDDFFCDSCECGECCCGCDEYGDDDDNDQEADVEFIERKLKFFPAGKKEHKRNPSKRFIACELEVDGISESGSSIDRICYQDHHSVLHDGSLSDDGFEIATSPASGDLFIRRIENLCRVLTESGACITKDCGYHVHVDARDFSYWDIRRLVRLYAKIEDALYSVVAPSRKSSSYCIPCGPYYLDGIGKSREKAKYAFAKTVYSLNERGYNRMLDRKSCKYDQSRYNALNLHSWYFRGTIECRMHQGSANGRKVALWGVLWAGILDYAYRNGEAHIEALTGSSFDILLAVAPTDEVREYLKERRREFSPA